MKVEILDFTHNPVDLISQCAGICYGKDDTSAKRVERCAKAGHDSVFEHAKVTFKLTGVSRNLTHQLVRHRLCSFNEMSMRYVKLGTTNYYVTPRSIWDNEEMLAAYNKVLDAADEFYATAVSNGIPAEDARYAIPGAIETEIIVTCNVRQLKHICELRIDKHAQWEIRNAMKMVLEELGQLTALYWESDDPEQWEWLIDEYIMEGKEW